MNKLRWQAILMGLVIIVITGFQAYWLRDNYNREKNGVEIKTDALFHETVRQVQDSLLQQKWAMVIVRDSAVAKVNGKIFTHPVRVPFPALPDHVRAINKIGKNMHSDSMAKGNKKGIYISLKADAKYQRTDTAKNFDFVFDSLPPDNIREVVVVNKRGTKQMSDSSQLKKNSGKGKVVGLSQSVNRDRQNNTVAEVNTMVFDNGKGKQFKIQLDSLINDSIPVTTLDSAFKRILKQEKLDIPFTILRQKEEMPEDDEFMRRPMFGSAAGYKLELGNTFPYLLEQILLPILFSVFLVGITVFAFVLLYRSLLRQHRLAQMKNDLISNITHELKTPIATVGVAIEALKNFNAIQDPQRTKEYLDISQNELQRLGLLVDKVLKLSMFEKKEIELKYEIFDLKEVVNEVVASLRLQIEKYNARVTVEVDGDTNLKGDRLHLLSVVFNLLDNALKYSKGNAAIQVVLKEDADNIIMKVTDNGIGIPAAYKEKIFEKFFRVPTGDTHNAKGHGLGLSYIGQVVRQHNGSIAVDSHEGIGSTFTITLPKNQNS
jgi:two-component system, OmpR family, phosphate regulon sensor histidine kinase PhoR